MRKKFLLESLQQSVQTLQDENEKLMPPRIPRKSSRYGLDVIEESDVVEEGTLFFFLRNVRRFRLQIILSDENRSVSTR